MSKHYVNEIGTTIILDTGIVLGSITEQIIKYRKPDGKTTGTFSADLYSSYSQLAQATGTYFITYTLESGDISTPGEWRFQAQIAAINGTWYGETVKVNIYDNFE